MEKLILPVKGMRCASCAYAIEKKLKSHKGVEDVRVNYASEKAYLEYDPENVDLERLNNEILPLGYRLMHEAGSRKPEARSQSQRDPKSKLEVGSQKPEAGS